MKDSDAQKHGKGNPVVVDLGHQFFGSAVADLSFV